MWIVFFSRSVLGSGYFASESGARGGSGSSRALVGRWDTGDTGDTAAAGSPPAGLQEHGGSGTSSLSARD